MIMYLAGAIQAFVMYCVNGTSRSSVLIESTDSMIYQGHRHILESGGAREDTVRFSNHAH